MKTKKTFEVFYFTCNLKYMKVSLFEISYKKKLLHDIILFLYAPVYNIVLTNFKSL